MIHALLQSCVSRRFEQMLNQAHPDTSILQARLHQKTLQSHQNLVSQNIYRTRSLQIPIYIACALYVAHTRQTKYYQKGAQYKERISEDIKPNQTMMINQSKPKQIPKPSPAHSSRGNCPAILPSQIYTNPTIKPAIYIFTRLSPTMPS
jgi:hypothetical protein